MPNWCQNEVTVTGDEDKLKEFRTYCLGEWYHGECGDQTIWVVNSDGLEEARSTGNYTDVSYGEYKDNPDYCGGKEFKDTCDKRQKEFSFRSILPLPQELEHTSSPANIFETQKDIDTYLDDLKTTKGYDPSNKYFKSIITKCMTREYSDNLKNMYGADNWYDWSYQNWGTKWDASDVDCENDGWMLKYDFDTAWNPPEGIHAFLVDKFSDVEISWFFREEGQEMAGYL